MSGANPEVLSIDSDSSEEQQLTESLNTSLVRNRQTTTSAAPAVQFAELSDDASSPKRLRTAPARIAGPSTRNEKRAAAEARAELRFQARAQKQAAIEAKRRAKIDQAFASYEGSGAGRWEEVELLVSPTLYNDVSSSDVLERARVLFPNQILSVDQGVSDLVSWRRRGQALGRAGQGVTDRQKEYLAGRDVDVCVVIFSAATFMDRMEQRTLDDFAAFVLSRRREQKVIFVISGIQRECKKRARAASKVLSGAGIYDMRCIQDCLTHVYMVHGIRTHSCPGVKEVGQYIVDVTNAVASQPYHRRSDFLESTLIYRDSSRLLRDRTIVVAKGTPRLQQRIQSGSDEESNASNRLLQDHNSHDACTTVIRSERTTEPGAMYLAFLHQVPGISPSRARAIREVYPTLHHLFVAYKGCSSIERQHSLLADISVGHSSRRLGHALSKAVAVIFTSLDPKTVIR